MKRVLLASLVLVSVSAWAQQYPTEQQVPEMSHSSDPTIENFNRWQYRQNHQAWEQSVEYRLEQQQKEIEALKREIQKVGRNADARRNPKKS